MLLYMEDIRPNIDVHPKKIDAVMYDRRKIKYWCPSKEDNHSNERKVYQHAMRNIYTIYFS